MEIFGRTRSGLRRAGQLIPDLDLLIGATALHHDLILLTRNRRHFTHIPGLRLYATV
jgi:tRNA(fMet)-specific endonuclease VapC